MYAMNYEITLPADYDMQIIRTRVKNYGHLLDDRAGLGLKTYLIRERGLGGSAVNQYASFYLWDDAGAMADFLVGGAGFQGIIRDFGRPPVHQWTVIATVAGPARAGVPQAASRRITALGEEGDPPGSGLALAEQIARETQELEDLARREGVHTAALAVDPQHWRLLRFVVWQDAVPAQEEFTQRYEVLHLSAPGLAGLPNGRHW